MKYDREKVTKLRVNEKLEVQFFEPQNENFAWQLDDFGTCEGALKTVSNDWSLALSKKNNGMVYNRMAEYMLIPNSSIILSKADISENVGIRKFVLQGT